MCNFEHGLFVSIYRSRSSNVPLTPSGSVYNADRLFFDDIDAILKDLIRARELYCFRGHLEELSSSGKLTAELIGI